MTWIIALILLFIALLMAPIMWSTLWYNKSRDNTLFVRQERTRDPRYFARSFEEKFLKGLMEQENNEVMLSRKEKVTYMHEVTPGEECTTLVAIAPEMDNVPKDTTFQKEIYAFGDVHFREGASFRAVKANGRMIFEKGTKYIRWADANGAVAVYDDCDLGISLTSGTAISLGKNCSFRRLYAPIIRTGIYPGEEFTKAKAKISFVYELDPVEGERTWAKRVNSDYVEDNNIANSSFVSHSKLVVDEGIIVRGSVRALRSVHLADGCVICGNVFANGDVHIGAGTVVLGNVFTQGNIYCEEGTIIGREGRICSLVARGNITFEKNCTVYGYVSNERGGYSCPTHKEDVIEKRPEEEKVAYLTVPTPARELSFTDAVAFTAIDSEGYRFHDEIITVVIPNGVMVIPRSMFFSCKNLEKVTIPDTVECIEEYAFAGCTALKQIDFQNLSRLKSIGHSAFDKCASLKEAHFPSSLEELGDAAFRDCTALETVIGSENIKNVGRFCFQNTAYECAINGIEVRKNTDIGPSPKEIFDKLGITVTDYDKLQAEYEKAREKVDAEDIADYIAEIKEQNKAEESLRLKRVKKTGLGIFSLAALLAICLGAIFIESLVPEEVTPISSTEKQLEENQGLPIGTTLDDAPDVVTNTQLIFKDRILRRGNDDSLDSVRSALYLKSVFEEVNKRYSDIGLFLTVAPLRICFEEGFITDEDALEIVSEEQKKLAKLENNLFSRAPSYVNCFSLYPVLDEHSEEYIYFRTENAWTAHGAYYAADEFMKLAQSEAIPLEHFYETVKGAFTGSFKVEEHYSDRLAYFLFGTYNPPVMRLETKQSSPLVSLLRGGTGMFVGSSDDYYQFEGLADNGKSILLVGGRNTGVLAPWLVAQYENIVMINITRISKTDTIFWQIFEDYDITDMLVIMDDETATYATGWQTLRGLSQKKW